MTTPAIQIVGQQSTLALAIAPDSMQAAIGYPFSTALCTRVLKAQNFATADPTIQDIISCDGRHLTDRPIREWKGAFQIEVPLTSQDGAWALAIAWGAATAPSTVAESNAVFTLTITATGGVYQILLGGKPTESIAYNANAAAIQSAIDAVIGAGLLTVGSTGPFTLTAAGAYLNTDVRKPGVSTVRLTGGTANIVTTTPGGAARKSYTLTQDDADQGPAITAVLGYQGGTAWRLADLTVESLEIVLQDDGTFNLRITFVWQGLFYKMPSFSWPACAKPKLLDIRDSQFQFASADHTSDWRALTYNFGARPEGVFVTVSQFAQAWLRQFPTENTWKAAFQETLGAGSVYELAAAGAQDGTLTTATIRLGSASDGLIFANPEALVRFDGSVQDFGGRPPVGRVPVTIDALKSDGTSTKPTSCTAITSYTGGFLASA